LLQTPIYSNTQYACVLPNKYHHLNFQQHRQIFIPRQRKNCIMQMKQASKQASKKACIRVFLCCNIFSLHSWQVSSQFGCV